MYATIDTGRVEYKKEYVAEIVICLPSLLVDCASEDGIKSGVDLLADVFYDKRLPIGDGSFDIAQPFLLGQLDDS